jgi:hypothetical protein
MHAVDERPGTLDVVINLVAFQAAWLSLVIGAANGYATAGVAVAVAAMALHLYRSPDATAEAKLMAAALLIGLGIETAFIAGGFVAVAEPGPFPQLAPLWLAAMWPVFATSLNVACRPLRPWVVGAAVFGGAFVPVAYYVGVKLGAMTMPDPMFRSLSVIGLAWAVALPVLFTLARRWDGWRDA